VIEDGRETMARTTAAEVAALIEDRLGLEVEGPEQHLFDTGVLDSLSFVNLIVEIETAFGVTVVFEDVDFDDFATTARIAHDVDRLRAHALAEAG
jgi:D-alanine--poly(phosphoribitol) ligase subunit 2